MKKDLTFSKAFSELKKLVEQIEGNNVPLDSLADKVKKANEYIKFCETKLRTIENDIKNAVKTETTRTKKKKGR
jgi:exodeoxyribonuclease VII small subunit